MSDEYIATGSPPRSSPADTCPARQPERWIGWGWLLEVPIHCRRLAVQRASAVSSDDRHMGPRGTLDVLSGRGVALRSNHMRSWIG